MRDDEMTYERLLALDAPAAKDNKLSRERRKQVEKVLKSKVYDPSDKDTSCVVCLEEFSSRDKQIKQLPCRHLFHRKCISKWLDHDLRCPTCRTDILSSAA